MSEEQYELIKQLYSEMYFKMCNYANNALNNRELAEEAVQDSFRIACSKPYDIAESENPRGWLMNTLKFVIRSTRRNQAKLNNLVIEMMSRESTEFCIIEDSLNVDVKYGNMVGREEFELLKLISIEGCSILDAANKYGISVEACKKRIQRARKKIQKIIEKDDCFMSPLYVSGHK